MEFDPAIVDLFGGGETLDARRTPRIGDHYFVTGPVGLRSHFALNRLVSAFEKVEHADGLLHGPTTERLSCEGTRRQLSWEVLTRALRRILRKSP